MSRHSLLRAALVLGLVSVASRPAAVSGASAAAAAGGLERIADDLQVEVLAPGVWRWVAWFDLKPYGRTPASGLAIVSGGEALLVNTAWTDDQAGRLADWVERRLGARVTTVVPTHSHADTMGGLAELRRRGATSWAQARTVAIARAGGLEVPRRAFEGRTELKVGVRVVEAAFHGAGHSPDNIVVWLPAEQILFAGCLAKAAAATDLGSIADASPAEWSATLKSVQGAYPGARVVIPGHGEPGDRRLLAHTLELLANAPGK